MYRSERPPKHFLQSLQRGFVGVLLFAGNLDAKYRPVGKTTCEMPINVCNQLIRTWDICLGPEKSNCIVANIALDTPDQGIPGLNEPGPFLARLALLSLQK